MLHPELQHKNTRITWPALNEILGGAFPSLALRPMHRLGLLIEALPEFRTIDSLVVRDFYHRYTVDEHSLRAIEHLQELSAPPDQRGLHFAPLWRTVDRRDLLILSLLLHEVGKGMPVESHVAGSMKALERATEAFKKRKPDEAVKELKKAVEIYPRYALAWFDLGRVYESRNRFKEAVEAYGHSVEADDKYLYPYERLYILTANQEQWPQVLEFTRRVLRLDPLDFPRAYYFSAIANLNLNDLDAAEKSAREAVKLDLAGNPRAGYVLGVILARKQNFAEASDLLRAYLKAVPKSTDADMVKRQLGELEKYVGSK
jgi:tetratricopeptide (TPR) repeat protein